MKQLIGLFAMVLVLSGCASRERYETELQSYVGKPISVVMDSWGYPSGSFEAPNGNLVYVWDKQSQYISPPTVQTSVFGGSGRGISTGIGFGFGGYAQQLRCQTFFEVDKVKTILTWRLQDRKSVV